jgi:lysophospholipase L1-like esterase
MRRLGRIMQGPPREAIAGFCCRAFPAGTHQLDREIHFARMGPTVGPRDFIPPAKRDAGALATGLAGVGHVILDFGNDPELRLRRNGRMCLSRCSSMSHSRRSRCKRLTKTLGIAAVVALGVADYWQYFLSRPIGEGACGPQVGREAFAKPWTDRHVLLVGIGDSVTAGFGATSQDRGYFNRLVKNPADEFAEMKGVCLSQVIGHLDSENLAIAGSTSKEHLAVIEGLLLPQNSNVFGLVVITTGGNDLIHNYGRSSPEECAMYGATLTRAAPWIAAFRSRLDKMLGKIQACFPGGFEIYLGDIYDPTDGIGDAPSVRLPPWPDVLAIHAKYNEAIADFAQAHPNVHVVPLRRTFLGHGAHCRQFWRSSYVRDDPTYWFHRNVEDPNDRGYDAIRRLFLKSIVEHSVLVPRQRSSDRRGVLAE